MAMVGRYRFERENDERRDYGSELSHSKLLSQKRYYGTEKMFGSEDILAPMQKSKSQGANEHLLNITKRLKGHGKDVADESSDGGLFGDKNLTKKFVWKKKIERDLDLGMEPRCLSSKVEKQKQEELLAEIERIKRRREERATARINYEKRIEMLAREQARAESEAWTRKEEEFELKQSKIRVEIHNKDGETKYASGSSSSKLFEGFNGNLVLYPEADMADPEWKRDQVLKEQQRRLEDKNLTTSFRQEQALALMESSMMEDDLQGATLGFDSEVSLESQVCEWQDKYRPRKPMYLNKVYTGYSWSKYNRLHYDQDHPPPKAVQGYKFNIFYPDLLDATRAPVVLTERDGSNGETCVIRFSAGPPYEDIAFKIVNEEWDHSQKSFKCAFELGILKVYFNFKRYRYRR